MTEYYLASIDTKDDKRVVKAYCYDADYKLLKIKYDRKSGYAFYKGHYENTKVETVSRWGKVKSGIWIGYRNGKYYNSYDGSKKDRYQSDEKTGGKGFEYRTLFDIIKSCF